MAKDNEIAKLKKEIIEIKRRLPKENAGELSVEHTEVKGISRTGRLILGKTTRLTAQG